MKGLRKILILGHRGMLGTMCVKYFTRVGGYQVETLDDDMRFDPNDPMVFINACIDRDCEYVINAIGMIPQKHKDATFSEYFAINTLLPMLLCHHLTLAICYFPSTDCVFSGRNHSSLVHRYPSKRQDATDWYGMSKALMEQSTKDDAIVIRASLIGPYNSNGLLGWFLSLDKDATIDGYANHIWNGVTTLQWCKFVDRDIVRPDSISLKVGQITHYGITKARSKYDLLRLIGVIFERRDVQINKVDTETPVYRDLYIPNHEHEALPLEEQLWQLKEFLEEDQRDERTVLVYNNDTDEVETMSLKDVLEKTQ